MPGAIQPNLGLTSGWTDTEDGWGAPMNANLRRLDSLVLGAVEDKDLTTPPAHTAGNRYIVASGATGAWSGHAGEIALSDGSDWTFYVPKRGWRAYVKDEYREYAYDTSWYPDPGVFNVRAFGAKGDDVTNDTAAIQAAIDAANTAGGGTVYFPRGTYKCIDIFVRSNCHLFGYGATLSMSSDLGPTHYLLRLQGGDNPGATAALTATGNIGTKVLTVASTTGFVVGDYVSIEDTNHFEQNRITALTATTITLSNGMLENYLVANGADVTVLDLVVNASVHGLRMNVLQGTTVGGGVRIHHSYDCVLEDCLVRYAEVDPAYFVFRSTHIKLNRCASIDGQSPATSGFAYGIATQESAFCVFSDCYSENMRENILGDKTKFCGFVNCVDASSYDDSFNSHGTNVKGCYFLGCFSITPNGFGILAGFAGAAAGDSDILIANCVVYRPQGSIGIFTQGASAVTRTKRVRIENNIVIDPPVTGIYTQYTDDVHIVNNTIQGGASTDRGIAADDADRCFIIGNKINNVTDATIGPFGIYWNNLTNSVIESNHITEITGANLKAAGTNSVVVRNNIMDDDTVSFDGTEVLGGNRGSTKFDQTTGAATVASGTTSIAVTHNSLTTPTAGDIIVTPTNNPTNDPGSVWISAITATQFTINVRNDPGVGGATFAWQLNVS